MSSEHSQEASFDFELLRRDSYLQPHRQFFEAVREQVLRTENRLTQGRVSLAEFAMGHFHFGAHRTESGWVFREWAPWAIRVFLIGPFSDWRPSAEFCFSPKPMGQWELEVPEGVLGHEALYRLYIQWPGGHGERIPAYARRVVQDAETNIFSAQLWAPDQPYQWQHQRRVIGEREPLLIYESHVGMALEDAKVSTYNEFREQILPRVVEAGYNAVELMAVQEHPYYGSFGYQVSSFFAPSSRFGTPDEWRALIDEAHRHGVMVFLDLVHSHAVKNEVEGIAKYDGTHRQFFHEGDRGTHPVWDSRLFDYGKAEVLHFLLSNVRYWIEDFRFDGFRFDGITSMLYLDHGLGEPFTSYDRYFSDNLDRDALCYLALANKLAHSLEPVITIAEDVSGLPGLAAPLDHGGFGFDYRLAMGTPDFWVETLKTAKDEDWNVERMYWELTNRRADEKTVGYAESHDQALVGDKTIIFRLLDAVMYDSMMIHHKNHLVDRGLALHKMIRLVTLATAGHGYLNFMGNEFGHPEWIDFPREGNNWSYHYARRQWSLRDNPELQYGRLADFDKQMTQLARRAEIYAHGWPHLHHSHVEDQVLAFSRASHLFAFNFNPERSFTDYAIRVPAGEYTLVLDSDAGVFGGNGRVEPFQKISVSPESDDSDLGKIFLYLPTRTALVFQKLD